MGAKLNSKTYCQNTFLDFVSRFVHIGLRMCKNANMNYTKILVKNKISYEKTENLMLISNPLKTI
jgi:hypothetical protein